MYFMKHKCEQTVYDLQKIKLPKMTVLINFYIGYFPATFPTPGKKKQHPETKQIPPKIKNAKAYV